MTDRADRNPRRGNRLEDLGRDVVFALRTLAGRPGFTLFALLSLALGIGANTAIFSLTKAVFLRSIPVHEPERLVSVFATDTAQPGFLLVSYPNYRDVRDLNRAFSGVASYRPVMVRLSGEGGAPDVLPGDLVSGNYFEVLGVRAEVGRIFGPPEDQVPGRNPVVVLSHSLWSRRFGADPQVIGRQVELNGHPFTVIGVLDRTFNSLSVHGAPAFFVPSTMYGQVLTGLARERFEARNTLMTFAVGRLKPGVDARAAEAEVKRLADLLRREHPLDNRTSGLTSMPLIEATIHPDLQRQFSLSGGIVITTVLLLLLTACANVANLQLARALERRKEMAIRTSVGAGRGRLARQLLTEGMVLALLGGAAGLLVAVWLRNVLWALRPAMVDGFLDVSLDGQVLAFALAISVASGLLFGLVPLALVLGFQPVAELQAGEGGQLRRGQRFSLRGALVGLQVMLALISLVGAGLFLGSLQKMRSLDAGFDAENLAVVELNAGWQDLDEPAGEELFRRAVERVESLPGVRSVGLARGLPLAGGAFRSGMAVEGGEVSAKDAPSVSVDPVSASFFATLGIPILQGRGFTAADREGAPAVAVINQTMARRFWPDQDAVGRRFRLTLADLPIEVVGVARDAKYDSLAEEPQPYAYVHLEQRYSPDVVLYARAEKDASALLETIRREIQTIAPDLPLTQVETMQDTLDRSLWGARMGASLLTLFAVLAVCLSAIGIYGVMARAVGSRRRELGIRMALGAARGDVLRMIVIDGMRQVAIGVVLGLVLAALAAPAVSGLLFDFSSIAPLVFGGAALLLVLVALVAMLLPARHASALDPSRAIRGGQEAR